MTIISLIAAVDTNGGLGKNNQLLCHLPADLKHFKEHTLGKPIIMGRKTFESIGKALPGRLNIVLSKQNILIDGVTVVHSLKQALDLVGDVPEVMIIGGSVVFAEALPLAQRIYLTIIQHQFFADVFFPDLNMNHWQLQKETLYSHDVKNQFDMLFCHYDRI